MAPIHEPSHRQEAPPNRESSAATGEGVRILRERANPLAAYRPGLMVLLRENPSLVLTLTYLLLTAVGIVYDFFLFQFFHIQILDYAEAGDFLFAAFKEPILFLFSLGSLAFLGALVSMDESWRAKSEGYAELARKMESSRWYSSEAMYALVIVSYFTAMTMGYAMVTAHRIRTGNYKKVDVQLITDATPPGHDARKSPPTVLMGTTGKYLFLYSPDAQTTQILPVSSVLRLTVR